MIDYEDIDCIDHHGIVTAVDAAAGTVTVIIKEEDECDCCPAAKLCTIKDKTADRITVASDRAGDFKKGEEVTLRASERMHRKAILLATVIPCVVLVAVMVGVYLITFNQLAAALCGLGTMIAFFIILYLCRNHVAHEFNLEILKF